MTYNLLNYPGTDTSRNQYFRTVMSETKPEILVVQEMTSQAGVDLFLNNVMNTFGVTYASGTFIDGYDTDNAVFYKTSHFTFVSNTPFHTPHRDINEFKLVHTTAGDTLRIFSVHLKASSGVTYEAARAGEADTLRKYTDGLPAGSNFMVCGDFNFYHDAEPAYQKLLAMNPPGEGEFIDPISMTGVWNNSAYAHYHTQSPRTRSFGGGITGGMDDRFDLMLYSKAIGQPGGISYVAGSCTVIGNDGNHYNDSVNQQPNTAVSVDMANALHYAADHLPVYCLLEFEHAQGTGTVKVTDDSFGNIRVVPNPFQTSAKISFALKEKAFVKLSVFTILGELVTQLSNEELEEGNHEFTFAPRVTDPSTIYYYTFQQNDSMVRCALVFSK